MTVFYTKLPEKLEKVGPETWNWMEVAVLADFWLIFAKMSKSVKKIMTPYDQCFATDLYTKLPEKLNKVGLNLWKWMEMAIPANFWLIFLQKWLNQPISISYLLPTYFYIKSPEKLKNDGPDTWKGMEVAVLADFSLIFAKMAKSVKIPIPPYHWGLATDSCIKFHGKSK